MRAFVTGGTGFIGGNLVRALLRAGVAVRVLVRPGADTRVLSGLTVERAAGDVTDPASIRAALSDCEWLFHVAALYAFWPRDAAPFERVNVEGTRAVLETAGACGVRRIVYTSSVAALAVPCGSDPVDETTPVDPSVLIGAYKRSKYRAEQIALDLAERGLPVVIVNPTFPVGPYDVKPTPTGRMILDYLNRRMPAYLDTGMNVVDVEAVAEAHVRAAERGRVGERYILGGENLTMRDILRELSELTGLPLPRVRLPYAPVLALSYANAALSRLTGSVPRMTPDTIRMSRHRMYYDAGKAVRELDLAPASSRQALAKAVAWFRGNGYVRR